MPRKHIMKSWVTYIPFCITIVASALMALHGPIVQLPHYHEFADQSMFLGVPHTADVLSNAGFAVVGVWGWFRLRPMRGHPAIQAGWPGYQLFLAGLVLTAVGSSFYHLAPDNARLLWDRLPIALACAGLLAAVRTESRCLANGKSTAAWLALFAVGSVAWWYFTDQRGQGDLRPYLLLQALPLVLIPVWQSIYRADRADRIWFGLALLLYVFAKAAEIRDHELLTALGWVSGHTLKHLLATAAAALLAGRLAYRVHEPAAPESADPMVCIRDVQTNGLLVK
jgi:hypothetical protein